MVPTGANWGNTNNPVDINVFIYKFPYGSNGAMVPGFQHLPPPFGRRKTVYLCVAATSLRSGPLPHIQYARRQRCWPPRARHLRFAPGAN